MRKLFFISIVAAALVFWSERSSAQAVESDQWAATDGLGRALPGREQTRARRDDRKVAMFYWTWHTSPITDYRRIGNITQILREHPEAIDDYDHPAWDIGGNSYFWDEPLLGYYKTTDPWVLRKHAEMLADAGVDVVFFDCTNASLTWKSSYDVLIDVWTKAQGDGVNVPKIAFMLPFGPVDWSLVSLRQLYEDIYKPGRAENLWFYLHGKPCIMAYPDNLTDSPEDRAIRDFFTFRPGQPDIVDGPGRPDQWGWLETYPQHKFVERPDGGCEEMVVCVAQNANDASGGHCCAFNAPGTYGRSYTQQRGQDTREDAYLYGLNIQEQWDYALQCDPDLIFVTGWNEFIAGKHIGWHPAPIIRLHSPISSTGNAAAISNRSRRGAIRAMPITSSWSTISAVTRAFRSRRRCRSPGASGSAVSTVGTAYRPISGIIRAIRCTGITKVMRTCFIPIRPGATTSWTRKWPAIAGTFIFTSKPPIS